MYYPLIRKALFQLDPERAHEVTFRQLSRITGTPLAFLVRQSVPTKPVSCMGLSFKNPLGLAAGLDKNGECIDAFGAMGFGPDRGEGTAVLRRGRPLPDADSRRE